MKKIRITGALLVILLWAGLTLGAWFHSPQDFSMAERRKLEQFPKLTVKTLWDGKFMGKFEDYTLDQFPLRDGFRQLKAGFTYGILRQGDNNGIYLAQGHGAKLEYPLNPQSLQKAVDKFDHIYLKYLKDTGSHVVFSVVPDKSYFLAAQNGYPAMNYGELFSTMENGLPWATYVDLTECLSIDDYYRTDTHWRQEEILGAAEKLAHGLGVSGPNPADFRKTALERPFYGVYYGQAALPMEPETMYILESDVLDGCTVNNLENNKTPPVYDRSKENSKDQYDVFLGGPVSIQVIENPQGPDRELLVFRDSFGSSMVPLLIQDYSRVTLIDTRYVPADYLDRFIDFHGQDVLMLYSPMVLNQSSMLK